MAIFYFLFTKKLGYFIVILFVLLLMQNNVFGEEVTSFGAIWRSTLFPGSGQFYSSYNTKGYFFAGAEILTIGTGIYFYLAGNYSWKKYEEATNSEDATKYYDETSKNDKGLLYCQYIYLGIWTINMIDILFFNDISDSSVDSLKGKNQLMEETAVGDLMLRYNQSMNTIQLVWTKRF